MALDHGFEAAALSQARRLFGVAFSILGDSAEAEDAVQESLVLAWRSWDRLRDESAGNAWLTRICVNHCLRRRGLLHRLRLGAVPPSHAAPPATADATTLIGAAFDRLSARQRAEVDDVRA